MIPLKKKSSLRKRHSKAVLRKLHVKARPIKHLCFPCSISSRGENIPSVLLLQGSLRYLSVLSWYGLQCFNPFYLMILWSWWYYGPVSTSFMDARVAYVFFYITSWRAPSAVKTCAKRQPYWALYCKVNTCPNPVPTIAIPAISVRNHPEVQKQEIVIERNMLGIDILLIT